VLRAQSIVRQLLAECDPARLPIVAQPQKGYIAELPIEATWGLANAEFAVV
jgi:hypothetical protein